MLVKYLGTADEADLVKGFDFHGRLAEGLPNRVVWNRANNFVVDSDEAGLTEEAVEILLEEGERFKDVTGMKTIPSSLHEKVFLGHGRGTSVERIGLDVTSPELAAKEGGAEVAPGGSLVDATTTTTGGSTDPGGDATAPGRGGRSR